MQLTKIFSLLLAATTAFASPTPVDKRATRCSPVGISAQSSAAVVSAFTSSGVVPTLIPNISPRVAVTVSYGSKQVKLGNKFTTLRKKEYSMSLWFYTDILSLQKPPTSHLFRSRQRVATTHRTPNMRSSWSIQTSLIHRPPSV